MRRTLTVKECSWCASRFDVRMHAGIYGWQRTEQARQLAARLTEVFARQVIVYKRPAGGVAAGRNRSGGSIRLTETQILIRSEGFEPISSSPEAFSALLLADAPKWVKVVKASGIKID